MYIIVNKVTFIVVETIMAINKNSIKPINTTSLSDNESYLSLVATHLLQCSFPMLSNITYNRSKSIYINKISQKKITLEKIL